MATIEALQADNKGLRRKLREAELREGGLVEALADQRARAQWMARRLRTGSEFDLSDAISTYKFRHELSVVRVLGIGSQATKSIYEFLEEDYQCGVSTLQDLAHVARADVAVLKGVGRMSMSKLDAAMAEHGLEWADEVSA